MMMNSNPSKREAAAANGGESQGPLSKDNFERFHKSMQATVGCTGTRRAAKYD
jgi:hypothetical protein